MTLFSDSDERRLARQRRINARARLMGKEPPHPDAVERIDLPARVAPRVNANPTLPEEPREAVVAAERLAASALNQHGHVVDPLPDEGMASPEYVFDLATVGEAVADLRAEERRRSALFPVDPRMPPPRLPAREESHAEWLARARFEDDQLAAKHRAARRAAEQREREERPRLGELWTATPTSEWPPGTPMQQRAWLQAAVGPPVVMVLDVTDEGSVRFRYVGLTPCNPESRRPLASPYDGNFASGWAAGDFILQVSLDLFRQKFDRVP